MNKRGFDSNATGARALLRHSIPFSPGRLSVGRRQRRRVGSRPVRSSPCGRPGRPLRPAREPFKSSTSRAASPGEAKKVNSSCCAGAWENPAPCAWPGLIGARCVWGVCACVCACVCVCVSGGPPSSGPGEPRIRGGGGSGAGPRANLPSSPSPRPRSALPGRRALAPGWRAGNSSQHPPSSHHHHHHHHPQPAWTPILGFERGRNLLGDCGGGGVGGGTRVAAAVTRCLTALRKRPGQPPASAQRLRLQRLRAARPPAPSPAPSLRPGGRRRTAGTRRAAACCRLAGPRAGRSRRGRRRVPRGGRRAGSARALAAASLGDLPHGAGDLVPDEMKWFVDCTTLAWTNGPARVAALPRAILVG
ncbi:translation initiation factor IF-2-like [Onychomys torridus]|uniref:translation initiation factor IF-2-like n=1 Tax=Onychomys torridus TaxID=38674 RepID=UPI00167FC4F7|nr:translation initiation factor IF-2-like [Onychomys torridus]